ncbi:MAG: hypothetical protein AB1609_18010 [Bacillota bacterium]
MKDPQFVSWRPMFHWTDSKIRVHAFYCVLAPMLASLLLREVHRRAQERGLPVPAHSIPDLLQTLGAIREVAHLYPPEARTPAHITLSERTAVQQQLFDLLDLGSLAPYQAWWANCRKQHRIDPQGEVSR